MIIGVTGKARSGKDSFSKLLAEEFYNTTGRRFTLMAYATELKLKIQKEFDLSYEQLWGEEKELEDKRYPKKEGGFWTPREIMQFYGTDCMRAIDDNFWVKSLFRIIEEKGHKNVIITDVRFPNEAAPVKERGGYTLKITSTRKELENVHGQDHASEIMMDDYGVDFTVVNDGTLDDLQRTAAVTVEMIMKVEKSKNN